MLVEGVKEAGQVDKKIRFLRRVPKDPFTNSTDWGSAVRRTIQNRPLGRPERVRRIQQNAGEGSRWYAVFGVVEAGLRLFELMV